MGKGKKIVLKRATPTQVLKRVSEFSGTNSDARIRQVFLNVSLVNRYVGLSSIAHDHGIDTTTLKAGDFLVFINGSKSKLAILGSNNFCGYLSHPLGHRLDLRILTSLPLIFKGQDFNYDGLLRPFLEEYFASKKKQTKEKQSNGDQLHRTDRSKTQSRRHANLQSGGGKDGRN